MSDYRFISQQDLEKISRHCPSAMAIYLICLNRIDDLGMAIFTKKQIEEELSEDYRSFKNQIKKLAREDILEWYSTDLGLNIQMVCTYDQSM